MIAPDLLGHGESAKPQGDYSLGAFASGLRDLLSVLDVDSVTIVGHSFGGGVAMQLAYQHPHLVDRLVLVASGGLGREVCWLLRLLALPGAEYLMPFGFPKPLVDRATDVGRALGRRNIRSPKLAEMWRGYSSLAGCTESPGVRADDARGDRAGGQVVNAEDRLVSRGAHPDADRLGRPRRDHPGRARLAAHELIPTSRLEILHGVGHFPHVEAPDRFNDVMLDFLATTAAGPIEPRAAARRAGANQ